MQMNKPIWIVEDTELMKSAEGRRKLQDTADGHKRLLILHGQDFGKVIISACHFTRLNVNQHFWTACLVSPCLIVPCYSIHLNVATSLLWLSGCSAVHLLVAHQPEC